MSSDLSTVIPPESRLAPFNPTSFEAIGLCFEASKLGDGDVVFDIGCGDGRVLEWAASHNSSCITVGFECDPILVERGRARVSALDSSVSSRITFRLGDATTVDYEAEALEIRKLSPYHASSSNSSGSTSVSTAPAASCAAAAHSLESPPSTDPSTFSNLIVFCYLVPIGMSKMEPILRRLLNRGARIVTNMFSVKAWEDDASVRHEKKLTSTGLAVHYYSCP